MPTRKLPDNEEKLWVGGLCEHPEHNPPSHQVFKSDSYGHTCPSCGEVNEYYNPKYKPFKPAINMKNKYNEAEKNKCNLE